MCPCNRDCLWKKEQCIHVWNITSHELHTNVSDSYLREDLPVKEVLDVLQIGLLCTQASNAEVVQMLNNNNFMNLCQNNHHL
ncbi:hypothetical protein GIB67_000323 [Kingdonia uniflora]|uniref:Uncharacterized protein n=1 Tax=Kingdonia uniflora TaxID=39325 RepID=A0A7J7LCD6_9MAGN|nr:hypothetical protein GIB67_000323 [Kingdonia uniflora]